MAYNGSGTFTPSYTYSVEILTAAKLNASLTDIATGLSNSLTKDGQSTMTAPIKAADGSATAPSYSFGTDTNTGFYRTGADTVGYAAGGALIFSLTTSGMTFASGKAPTVPGFGMVPTGGIIMWSGAVADIPTGWLLCDGTNDTPDLRDKFVIGAKEDDSGTAKTNVTGSLTASGGSKDAINVSHTHTATSVVTDPGHTHDATVTGPNVSGDGAINGRNPIISIATESAVTGITVATTNSTEGSSGTNANLPPYYALAFIMKS